ncbi:MAG TPA: hypothetical protein VIN38_02450 [Thiobacillus sp.]
MARFKTAFASTAFIFSAFANASDKLDVAMLQRVADDMNKSLPTWQDRDTRLDKMTVGPGLAWTFDFTLVNAEFSKELADSFRTNSAPSVTRQFCSLPTTQFLIQQQVISKLRHSDRRGKTVSEIILDRDKCR